MSTLLQLRDRAKAVTNMTGDPFIPDSEWNTWINEGLTELREMIIDQNPGRFMVFNGIVTIPSGSSTASLSSFDDMDRIMGVDADPGKSTQRSLPVFEWSQRNDVREQSYSISGDIAFLSGELAKPALHIRPIEMAPGEYLIYYIPRMTALASDVSTVPEPISRWEEYAVLTAALYATLKNEDSPTVFERRLERMKERIMRRDGEYLNADAPKIGRRSNHYEDRLRRNW